MYKKFIFLTAVIFSVWFILSDSCFAMQLLTKEDAIKKVLGSDVQVITQTKELTEPALSKVTQRLGGSLIYYQKGSKSAVVQTNTTFDFYFGQKDGAKTAVALIDEEPGKWGPVVFIIALDLNGAVKQVEVLSYEEKRGQPIARRSFMSQFDGKTSKNPIEVYKDINGVSGATISSRCATFAVRKAIALYEELYLNK